MLKMRLDTAHVRAVAELLEPYRDDLEVFWDTLDGETDVMDAVGRLLEASVEAEAAVVAADAIIAKWQERKSALAARQQAIRASLKSIMMATGEKKIPHALGTVSLRAGSQSVVIHNPEEIPSQLCKVTVTPDKAAIKKYLQAGEAVAGAELVTGEETISIRTK
jgi:hypothetical protein